MMKNMVSLPRTRPRDEIAPHGKLEIIAWNKLTREILDWQKLENILFYQGNAEIIKAISRISPATYPRVINRMCVGDQGTIPSDSTVPKVPTKDLPQVISTSGLYHEIYRKDIDTRNENISGSTNECEFVATFDAADIALSAFSNPSQPRLNEVGLVLINPAAPAGIVRTPVTAPTTPPADEVVLSIRCFKSIPFEVANSVSVTIRYTIFMS
jgi:hypothetical protein